MFLMVLHGSDIFVTWVKGKELLSHTCSRLNLFSLSETLFCFVCQCQVCFVELLMQKKLLFNNPALSGGFVVCVFFFLWFCCVFFLSFFFLLPGVVFHMQCSFFFFFLSHSFLLSSCECILFILNLCVLCCVSVCMCVVLIVFGYCLWVVAVQCMVCCALSSQVQKSAWYW